MFLVDVFLKPWAYGQMTMRAKLHTLAALSYATRFASKPHRLIVALQKAKLSYALLSTLETHGQN